MTLKAPAVPEGSPAYAVAIVRDMVNWVRALLKQPPSLPSYTVAEVALLNAAEFYSSAPGNKYSKLIFVSNESGGAVPAFSDGTNFRRVTDRAIVS